mgnify:CR=1 FL=1
MATEDHRISQSLATQEKGSIGFEEHAGRIDSDFIQELEGTQRLKTLREMILNDPTIRAVLFAVDQLIKQVTWRVRPPSSSRQDMEAAEFVAQSKEDMTHSWSDMIGQINSRHGYGFAPMEMTYKLRDGEQSKFNDGRLGWKSIELRRQTTLWRWEFDDNTELTGFTQQDPNSFEKNTIPIEKLLNFTISIEGGSPEGTPLIRGAYRPYFYKKRAEELRSIGFERDLAGLPMVEVPPEILHDDASDSQKQIRQKMEDLVRNVRRNEMEGLLMPRDFDEDGNQRYKFSLVNSGGERQFDLTDVINQYRDQQLTSLMADFLLLGSTDQVGSFAMSQDRSNLFAMAVEALMEDIQSKFNKKAIPQLLHLNPDFQDIEETPKLEFDDIRKADAEEVGKVLRDLANAGAVPFAQDEQNNLLNSVFRLLGLPTVEEQQAPQRINETNAPRNQQGDDSEESTNPLESRFAVRSRQAARQSANELGFDEIHSLEIDDVTWYFPGPDQETLQQEVN